MLYAWTAWLGIVLVIQGIYSVQHGVYFPFFMAARGATVSFLSRLKAGLVYAGSGIGLLTVTIYEAFRKIEIKRSVLVPAGVLCISGILFLVKPTTGIKWAQDAYPDLSLEDPLSLGIARAVGGILLLFGLLFLAIQ
jgi:hypothetical protein